MLSSTATAGEVNLALNAPPQILTGCPANLVCNTGEARCSLALPCQTGLAEQGLVEMYRRMRSEMQFRGTSHAVSPRPQVRGLKLRRWLWDVGGRLALLDFVASANAMRDAISAECQTEDLVTHTECRGSITPPDTTVPNASGDRAFQLLAGDGVNSCDCWFTLSPPPPPRKVKTPEIAYGQLFSLPFEIQDCSCCSCKDLTGRTP